MDENFNGDNIFIGNKKLAEAVSKMDLNNLNPNINKVSSYSMKQDPTKGIQETLRNKQLKEEKYKLEVLNTLKSIEKNTDMLGDIVDLLQVDEDQQKEIISILTEIHGIELAETTEKAESILRKTMTKINSKVKDIDNVQKLIAIANTVYAQYVRHKDKIDPFIEPIKEIGKNLMDK